MLNNCFVIWTFCQFFSKECLCVLSSVGQVSFLYNAVTILTPKLHYFRLLRLPTIFFRQTEFWADYMPRIKSQNSFKTFYNWKEFFELWIRLLACLSTWLNPDGQLWIHGILMRVLLQLPFYYRNQINVMQFLSFFWREFGVKRVKLVFCGNYYAVVVQTF